MTCATDAESVSVTSALRTALPKGQYLLSTASWHVGCYGEGIYKTAQPASQYTGVRGRAAGGSATAGHCALRKVECQHPWAAFLGA